MDKYPGEPPALPLHGSKRAPLSDLQHWRVEIFSARGKCFMAEATRFTAVAAKEAATVALQSATSQEVLASRRVNEADLVLPQLWLPTATNRQP